MEKAKFYMLTKVERAQRAMNIFKSNGVKVLNFSKSVIAIEHGQSIVLYYPAKDWLKE